MKQGLGQEILCKCRESLSTNKVPGTTYVVRKVKTHKFNRVI